MILGKPSGISLDNHVQNVLDEAIVIESAFPFIFKKYESLYSISLKKRLDGAVKYHDKGKENSLWQKACMKDYQNYLEWKGANDLTFKDFEKAVGPKAGKYLRELAIRHEIFSLFELFDKFSTPVKVAIAAHHSKLGIRHENRWINDDRLKYKKLSGRVLWHSFINLNSKFKSHFDFEKAIVEYFEIACVRSYLQLSDRRASAKESLDTPRPFDAFIYDFPHNTYNSVQKLVLENCQNEILILRAPTGAGKTDSCLLWANEMIKKSRAERLIIAMPTRFTSNALSINVSRSLSSTGLYHSSAWYNRYSNQIKTGEINISDARKEYEFSRLLLSPVTVCTIDHLLMSLTLGREDHHTILTQLGSSCVVIDEADFYDDFTQANIVVLITFLRILKVPILIMSASIPLSALSMYKKAGFTDLSIIEDKSDLVRTRCSIAEIINYESVDEIEWLLEKCIEKRSSIIYVNTIARAIEFYLWFSKREIKTVLYHSRYSEAHKAKKENEIINLLGKDIWLNSYNESTKVEGICIMTQIGEMSINISTELMISEVCPIDRLVQRAGRINRFTKSEFGELYILVPQKDNELYPAPYGTYKIKNGWTPNQYMISTLEKIEIKSYSAQDFTDLVNVVYPSFESFSVKASENANKLKESFINNWIINPLAKSKEDDDDTQFWKSRDILDNTTVFIDWFDNNFFHTWSEFTEFKLENSISLPIYLLKNGKKNGKITSTKISIDDEEIDIYIAVNCYSYEYGLQITPQSADDVFL